MGSIEAKATMICGIFFIETHLRSGAPKKEAKGWGVWDLNRVLLSFVLFLFFFFHICSLSNENKTNPSFPPLPNPRGVR